MAHMSARRNREARCRPVHPGHATPSGTCANGRSTHSFESAAPA
jgi:hypothetical protein